MKQAISTSAALRAVLMLTAIVVSGCASIDIPPPHQSASDAPAPQQADSVIAVPVELNTLYVANEVRKRLENPVVSGRSEPISAKLLIERSANERVLIRKQVAPAKEGYWTVKYRREQRTFTQAYRCASQPWKWNVCWKDVTETVWVAFQAWVEPAAAQFVYIWREAADAVDAALNTTITVSYDADLTSFDFQMVEDQLLAEGEVVLNLSADYGDADTTPGPDAKLKGLLKGQVIADVNFVGDVRVDDDLQLVLNLPEEGVSIQFKDVSFPTTIAGIDFSSFADRQLHTLLGLFQSRINDAVREQLAKALTEHEEELSFGDQLRDFIADNSGPRPLQENIWLIPNPIRIVVSQPVGAGEGAENEIRFGAALIARPAIEYSNSEPRRPKPPTLEISAGDVPDSFNLYPLLFAEYDAVARKLRDALNSYLVNARPDLPFSIGVVTIYPAEGRIVLGVQVLDENGKDAFTGYLWGNPKLIPDLSRIEIEDADFTVETKNALVKIAAWFLDPQIRETVIKNSSFSYGPARDDFLEAIGDFATRSEFGTLIGSLERVEPLDLSLRNEDVAILANAFGHASFVSNEAAANIGGDSQTRVGAGPVETFDSLHKRLVSGLPGDPPADASSRTATLPDDTPRMRALRNAILGTEDEMIITIETAKQLGILDENEQIVVRNSDELARLNGFGEVASQSEQLGVARRAGDVVYERGQNGSTVSAIADLSEILNPREEVLIELPDGQIRSVRLTPEN